MNNLLLVSEFYTPSTAATAQLAAQLNSGLLAADIKTILLTSSPVHQSLDQEIHSSFLHGKTPSSNSIISKLRKALSFFVFALVQSFRLRARYGGLLIFSNPPFIGLIGVIVCVLLKKKYIFILQDVFPRSAVLAGIIPKNGLLYRLWWLVTYLTTYHSVATVVLSNDMKRRCISEFGSRTSYRVIHNWSVCPPKPYQPTFVTRTECLTTEPNRHQELTVQYSGNFGILHDILTILEAARLTKNYPITYQFIGAGQKTKLISEYRNTFNLRNIMLKPPVPLADLSTSISSSDLCFISLIPGSEDTVAPSKYYGVISAAKPVILISSNPNYLSRDILRTRSGFVISCGDSPTLATTLIGLLGKKALIGEMSFNALHLYHSNYSFQKSLDQYICAVQELLDLV